MVSVLETAQLSAVQGSVAQSGAQKPEDEPQETESNTATLEEDNSSSTQGGALAPLVFADTESFVIFAESQNNIDEQSSSANAGSNLQLGDAGSFVNNSVAFANQKTTIEQLFREQLTSDQSVGTSQTVVFTKQVQTGTIAQESTIKIDLLA